jgi:hypothetical protein
MPKPQIKAILVQEDVQEWEEMIKDDWQMAHSFQHPKGTLFLMVKETVQAQDHKPKQKKRRK